MLVASLLIHGYDATASSKLNKVNLKAPHSQEPQSHGVQGSVDSTLFEYAVHMRRLTPTFCQLFRLRPPPLLFVTLRGLCTFLLERRRSAYFLFLGLEPVVAIPLRCNASLVQCQTSGYLPSRIASPPNDRPVKIYTA